MIMLISTLDKQYSISTYENNQFTSIHGTENALFFSDCKKLLNDQKPTSIYLMKGPGSFTSTRFGILAAKTFSILWKIPIKSTTIMECIKYQYSDIQIILSTGTMLFFVYDTKTDTSHLLTLDQINFHQAWTTNTNIDKNQYYIDFPEILYLMQIVCKDKEDDVDPQPYYSIQPQYLKTEKEI